MDCKKAVLDIQAWIDGELGPEGEVELLKHLEQCCACRSLADHIRSVRKYVRRIARPVPSAALDRRVMASFLSSHPSGSVAPVVVRRPLGVWLSKPAMAFIAVAVVMFGLTAFYLGWTFGQSHSGNRPLVSQSLGIATAPPSEEGVRGTKAGDQGTGNLSWTGFQPILEPKIRIIGRQAQ
ncbi:MAG: hypothetical protein EHM23_23315 [Acidobacteria bacterium]|nr:MAG: hypothetical protein EHM23_23315 [Acidobacteriota bacterium]